MNPLLRRRRREASPRQVSEITWTTDEFSFVDDDGETVDGAGIQPLDQDGELIYQISGDQHFDYLGDGVRACSVAGVEHRHREVQSDGFAPGRRLRLVPDPKNSFDPNAIEVRSADGKLMAGFVPREIASELAPLFKRDGPWEAMSVWEWRTHSRGRVGLRMFLAPHLEATLGASQPRPS